MTNRISVSICIITCLRPKGLGRLLNSLSAQDNICPETYAVRIIVIDNDLTGENRKIVEQCSQNTPFPILLIEEPERGIPQARNKAVETAWDDDSLIFVDDDEVVLPGWLNAMLQTWERTGADVVTGPVKAILPDDAPSWATKSDTYSEIRQHETGEKVEKAYTNNTLISQNVLHSIQPAFDPFFRYTGSEDIHFFQRATQKGFRIVWCAEAEINEIVPHSRLKFSWLIKRSFRNGSGDAISRIRITPALRTYFIVFAMACGRCFYGTLFFLKGVFTIDWVPLIRGVRLFISGIGTYAGMLGLNYEEYKNIHEE